MQSTISSTNRERSFPHVLVVVHNPKAPSPQCCSNSLPFSHDSLLQSLQVGQRLKVRILSDPRNLFLQNLGKGQSAKIAFLKDLVSYSIIKILIYCWIGVTHKASHLASTFAPPRMRKSTISVLPCLAARWRGVS